jgi:Bacterial alpha-L-rhamnosidase C-terminal domain
MEIRDRDVNGAWEMRDRSAAAYTSIEKLSPRPGTVYLVYDEAVHIVGEYNSTAALSQETVWLGDIPIATIRPKTPSGFDVFYVHTNELNMPRKVTSIGNTLRWSWDPTPFGEGAPIVSRWRRANDAFTLELSIPPSSTATVFVPARSADDVNESGVPAATSPQEAFLRQEGRSAVYAVGSGAYRYVVTAAAP